MFAWSLARHPFDFPFALIGAVPLFSKELCELAGVLAEGRRVGVHLSHTVKEIDLCLSFRDANPSR